MTSARDAIASVALFAGLGLLYLLFGVQGLGHAFLGMALFYLCLGICTGYWVGGGADLHVIKLMEYLRGNGTIR